MQKVALLFAVVASGVGAKIIVAQVVAEQKPAPMIVSVDDIDERVILVGRLKKPLGTMMTVRGKWSYPSKPAKDFSLRFTVSHVDGKKMDKPVEFNVAQLDVITTKGKTAIPPYERHKEIDGKEWTIRGFETGSIELIPEEYFKEKPPFAVPYWFRPFTSKLTGVIQP